MFIFSMILYAKLFIFLLNFGKCFGFFCEICINHTLCKYPVPGSGPHCNNYDKSSLLSQNDVTDILHKINERRNYIALGLSRSFPQAANMRKVLWSVDLAIFAQRWVDQCHPKSRPDLKDTCRDLDGMSVGQNIASVLGAAPGLNIKSYVELWFMQIKDYSGNVAYYNQTKDTKTSDFTQLIWSKTGHVGCGKAKFNVDGTVIVRLVCNFATKGNVHGQPVYTIGYPATQCPVNTKSDDIYKGLCAPSSGFVEQNTNIPSFETKVPITKTLPATSFLRVFMRSNNTTNKNSDVIPTYKAWKKSNLTKGRRYQKARHAPMVINNSFANTAMPQQFHELQNDHRIEKGHSRVNHNLDNGYIFNHEIINNEPNSFRRSEMNNYRATIINGRKNINNQCTRKDSANNCCVFNRCTRGQRNTKTTTDVTASQETNFTYDPCSCDQHTTTSLLCNCQCSTESQDAKRSVKPKNNLAVKRGSEGLKFTTKKPFDFVPGITSNKESLEEYHTVNYNFKRIRDNSEHFKPHENNRDYANFDSFDYNSKRIKRQQSVKPFWRMDDYKNNRKPELLKSLHYTTLSSKKNRRTTTVKINPYQSITFDIKQPDKSKDSNNHPVTEKYLSFDELMHIRKSSTPDGGEDYFSEPARRHGIEILRESNETTTTEATVNTPFHRLKYCTRKLTCTWTMLTGPNSTGHGGRGSRTPPGYVDGCTRTSTCTRDYLERNRMDSNENINNNSSSDSDEDYCEKKSLNIRRRDSSYNDKLVFVKKIFEYSTEGSTENVNECICDRKRKKRLIKRREYLSMDNSKFDDSTLQSNLSYRELFYAILQKIRTPHSEHCLCNTVQRNQSFKNLFTLILIIAIKYFNDR